MDIDKTRVGKLANGGFLVVDAVPGQREIATSLWDSPGRFAVKVQLVAGETYYIKVSPRSENAKYAYLAAFGLIGGLAAMSLSDDKGVFQLEPVMPQEAQAMLFELELSD